MRNQYVPIPTGTVHSTPGYWFQLLSVFTYSVGAHTSGLALNLEAAALTGVTSHY